jgi:2-methylisocitrate lyase-like PEP mutase family enzyme
LGNAVRSARADDPAAQEIFGPPGQRERERQCPCRCDLDDTIKRLKAYEAAGADALMAPGLPDLDSVRAVCAAVRKPFNFMVGIKGKSFTVAALSAAGVKRISLATSLYRAAMTGLLNAAKEVREHGTFGYIDTSLATPEMNAFLRG